MDKIKASTLANLAYYSRFKPPVRIITFAAPSETLTNFPCLVKCNSTFNIGTSTGYDVHFQDLSGNELYFDLDYYDSVTGNGAWWVRVPSLPSTGSTSIKMLYGDSSITTNGSSPATVWSDYSYVYHFNDLNNWSSVIGSYTPSNTGSVQPDLSIVSNSLTGRGIRVWITTGYGSTTWALSIANAIGTTTGTISLHASTNVIGKTDRSVFFNTGWAKYQYNVSGASFMSGAGNLTNTITRANAGGVMCYGASCNSSTVSWAMNGQILSTSGATANQLRWDSPVLAGTGYAATPTELILEEMRISTTTFKSAAWLQYEQKQLIDHANYVTYGPEA